MLWRVFDSFLALLLIGGVKTATTARSSSTTDILTTPERSRVFTLRQIHHHGVQRFPRLHRYIEELPNDLIVQDDLGNVMVQEEGQYQVQDSSISVNLQDNTIDTQTPLQLDGSSSTVRSPNITDKSTVLSFAKMAANAYAKKDNSSNWKWQDVGSGFNYTDDFGWENDGLRGHVFADQENQTIVISIKGTSVAWLDDPDTTLKDVTNDNLLGSCCCAQGGPWSWKPVCDCKTSSFECNNTCLNAALRTKSSYLWAAEELYFNITNFYPGAKIWITGHSLGGVVSSLLGLTFDLPTVTFEAFPDALAASRLDLATPPGYRNGALVKPSSSSLGYHFGHSADPIFMGTCNGLFSYCSFWGYAFESQCHTGKRCLYDTMKDFGWSQDIRTHSIVRVIEDVLEQYDRVPECVAVEDCTDCVEWNFIDR